MPDSRLRHPDYLADYRRLSLESFHPKDAGTTGYAQVMDQELADIGYQGA
ncbi:hypothetical protein [Streptomyces incarnatus]|nr:hypothetical protein [Streptomyces incarnatus]